MMKRKFITLILLAVHLVSYAQNTDFNSRRIDVVLTWSEQDFEASTLINSVAIGDNIFMLKVNQNGFAYSKKSNITIHEYNDNMQPIQQIALDLKYNNNKATPIFLTVIEQKLFLLYLGYEESEKVLLISEINSKTANILSPPIILTKTLLSSQIRFRQSKDKNYFGVFTLNGNKKNSPKLVEMKCYTSDLHLLYETNASLDIPYRQLLLNKVVFDEDGNFFTIVRQPKNMLGRVQFDGFYWSYRGEPGVSYTKHLTAKTGVHIKNLDINISNDSIFIGGYYSEQFPTQNMTRGMICTVFHKNDFDFEDFTVIPLPSTILHHYLHDLRQRQLEKSNRIKEYEGLTVKHLQEWEGYGYLLVGEAYYAARSQADPTSAIGNIIVTLLDYSMSPIWSIPIEKIDDIKNNSLTYSHFLSVENNLINMLFYSNNKIDYGNGLILVQIEPDGSHIHDNIIEKKEERGRFLDKKCFKIRENEYYIYTRNMLKGMSAILKIE